jgi:hypothetical protein
MLMLEYDHFWIMDGKETEPTIREMISIRGLKIDMIRILHV